MGSRSLPLRSSLVLAIASALVLVFALTHARPAHAGQTDKTVAVLYFDYTGTDEDMKFLRKGLAQMLVSDLAGATPGITIVERERLEEVLAELDLSQGTRIDKQSAVEVGKLLSARYMVMGSYFEFRGSLQVMARLVDVETGAILGGKSRRAGVDDFFRLQQILAQDLRTMLREHLGGVVRADAESDADDATLGEDPDDRVRVASKASSRKARKSSRKRTKKRAARKASAVGGSTKTARPSLDASTAARYGRALDAMDRGDTKAARADLEAVVARSPSFQLASVDLASLSQ